MRPAGRLVHLVLLLPLAGAVWLGCPSGSETAAPTSRETDCRMLALARREMPESALLRPPPTRASFAEHTQPHALRGEPRESLPGVEAFELWRPETLELPRDAGAPLRWRIALHPRRFEGVDRVLVKPRLQVAGRRSPRLDARLLPVQRDEAGRFVALELDLSALRDVRGSGRLIAKLVAAPELRERIHQTQPLRVPDAPAWLEYAIGVMGPGPSQGPVAFRLEACREDACSCLHEETLDPANAAGRGWHDRILPLEGLGGETLSFRFTSRALAPPPGGYLMGLWERPRLLIEAGDSPPPGAHDLLLVSLDTLRADHLGAYGYARDTSPFMSGALAARATLFEHAVAPSTATAPSHMTLFTSLPPSVHGVVTNLTRNPPPEPVAMLATVLQDRGYVTGSVNENGALAFRGGFERGFDYHRQFVGHDVRKPVGFSRAVFADGRRFVERHPNQRWFLFLHTYEVHAPYVAPREYWSLFSEGDDPGHPDNQRVGPGNRASYPVRYDREIRHVDGELERLLRGLREDGYLDDAIVVVTSDHGEAFREHGTLGHGSDAYQETVHVPLFLMGPGIPAGRRISEPVGLIDVMPTLLDLLRIPAPAHLMGRSLVPLLSDSAAGPAWRERAVASETWTHVAGDAGPGLEVELGYLALRRGDHKLIRTRSAGGVRYELYDLAADPGEQHDLLAAGASVPGEVRALGAELIALARAHEARNVEAAARLGFPRDERIREAAPESLDPEQREALRALGYLE